MHAYPKFAELLEDYLSQADRIPNWLAKRLDVSPATVSRWLNDQQRPASPELVARIADILSVYDQAARQELMAAAGYAYIELPIVKSQEKDGISEDSSGELGNLPPTPSLFVGREEDLTELYNRLTSESDITSLTAVRGWPGVGKTTLAAVLAHDNRRKDKFPGVLWAELGETPNLLLVLGEWMAALGHSPNDFPTLVGRSNRLRRLLAEHRMLLIVDDVWDSAHVEPLRVGGPNCRMLITTREPEIARKLGLRDQQIYFLQVLSDEKAFLLLKELVPSHVAENDPEGLRRLAQELEGLPLALHVAGRLLDAEAAFGFGVSDLLTELADGKRIIEAEAPADRSDVVMQTTPTVAALLRKSTDRLDESTRERFALLGVFVQQPATFDMEAISAVWKVDDPRATLNILRRRGLIESSSDGRFYTHALLRAHARHVLES